MGLYDDKCCSWDPFPWHKQTNSQTDRLYKHLIGINVVQAYHVGDPNLPSTVTYSINFVFAQSMF